MKLRHRLTSAILLIAFSATTALPAAGIPQFKAPAAIKAPPSAPKAFTPPKVPVVKVPTTPKIPAVRIPDTPKVPVVRVPVVKVPVTPKVTAVRVPVVKVPTTPKVPAVKIPNTPRIVKTPAAPKIPAVKIPVVKTPSIKTQAVVSRPKLPATVKTPQIVITPVIVQKSTVRSITVSKVIPVKSGSKNSGNSISSITSAPPPVTRMTTQGGNNADSEKSRQKKDFSDIVNVYRRQKESDDAKSSDSDPYFSGGAFNRDLFRSDERLTAAFESQQIGTDSLLEESDSTSVAITRTRRKEIADLLAEAQIVGIPADDPAVVRGREIISTGRGLSPADRDKLKNAVANRGLDEAFGEAPEVSVKDLIKRGDKLLEQGKRPEAEELYEQAKDALKNGGKNSAKFRAGIIADVQLGFRPAGDLAIVSNPNAGAQNGAQPSGTAAKEPSTEKPAPNVTTPAERVPFDPATGKADTRRPAEVSTPEVAAEPAATAPGRDVSSVINFDDVDFEPEAPTDSSFVPIEPPEEFYAPDGAAEPGTPPSTDDDDILSPAPGKKDGEGGGNGEGNGNSGDDDDKDDDSGTETPPATSETEDAPAETTETEDTAEASEEGTPNPEARERGSRSGRLAEATGGRIGGDEQRRQNKAIDQRKNGNGAGGPNPEGNTSSGVMLTKEEQSAFAKNLGMKRGGGVTTPTGDESSTAVTDRDLKDIAARRGSTINPAGGKGDKGGSGLGFGKKGFGPGAPVPAPAPKGAQAAPAVGLSVKGAAVRIDTAKIQQNAR